MQDFFHQQYFTTDPFSDLPCPPPSMVSSLHWPRPGQRRCAIMLQCIDESPATEIWGERLFPQPKMKSVMLLMVQKSCVHQLRLVVYPVIYQVLYIPGGPGFLPSTVFLRKNKKLCNSKKKTQSSMFPNNLAFWKWYDWSQKNPQTQKNPMSKRYVFFPKASSF